MVVARFLTASQLRLCDNLVEENEIHVDILDGLIQIVLHLDDFYRSQSIEAIKSNFQIFCFLNDNHDTDHVRDPVRCGTFFFDFSIIDFLRNTLDVGLQISCYLKFLQCRSATDSFLEQVVD